MTSFAMRSGAVCDADPQSEVLFACESQKCVVCVCLGVYVVRTRAYQVTLSRGRSSTKEMHGWLTL